MSKYRRHVAAKRRTKRSKKKPLPPTVRKETEPSNSTIYIIVVTTAVLSYANSLNGDFVHDDISAIVNNADVAKSSPLTELFLNDFWGTPMADAKSHKSYRPLTTLTFRPKQSPNGGLELCGCLEADHLPWSDVIVGAVRNSVSGCHKTTRSAELRWKPVLNCTYRRRYTQSLYLATRPWWKINYVACHALRLCIAKWIESLEQGFRLNYMVSGLHSWWWHASNVALHSVCCVLVARTCITVARLKRPFAALAALLFAVHPIHTEAVAGLVGRADVLACIFFLSSLLVYHTPTSKKKKKKKRVWLSVMLGALSLLAKETGIMVLILNLALDFYRCWHFVKKSISSLKIEKKCTRLCIRSVKVLVSLALLVCGRLALLQGSWPTFSVQDNPAAFHPSFFVRLMTFCYIAAFNWWLLLYPWTLSHDWQMGSVPLVTSIWDPRNLLTCAALLALLAMSYRCLAGFGMQRHKPLVVGLLLLVVPFLPASNLLVTVGFVIAERVLYIPSVGSVIIIAYGVQLMWHSKPRIRAYLVVGVAILAASGISRTYTRNADWRDRATLLKTDLVTLPHNAKLHYNFGNYLREIEQPDRAIKHYKEALRLWPSYASAHNNIGILLTRPEDAELHYLEALKYNEYHANALFNLGKLYKKTGRTQQAISMLEKCIWIQPTFMQAHIELLNLKLLDTHRSILAKLVEVEPENWEHNVLYGHWLREKGLPGPASQLYLEASRLIMKHRFADNPKGDLVPLRYTALTYRAQGQASRTLQLITRWHTWRRGRLDAAAVHLYLQDWKLKRELETRVKLYSEAAIPKESTSCFDNSQLTAEDTKIEEKELKIEN